MRIDVGVVLVAVAVLGCQAGDAAVPSERIQSQDAPIVLLIVADDMGHWNLTAERVARSPDGLDLPGLLDRIESEMGTAPPATQWTMNSCLAQIGICFPKHRKRALAIGESLGIYRDDL